MISSSGFYLFRSLSCETRGHKWGLGVTEKLRKLHALVLVTFEWLKIAEPEAYFVLQSIYSKLDHILHSPMQSCEKHHYCFHRNLEDNQ